MAAIGALCSGRKDRHKVNEEVERWTKTGWQKVNSLHKAEGPFCEIVLLKVQSYPGLVKTFQDHCHTLVSRADREMESIEAYNLLCINMLASSLLEGVEWHRWTPFPLSKSDS